MAKKKAAKDEKEKEQLQTDPRSKLTHFFCQESLEETSSLLLLFVAISPNTLVIIILVSIRTTRTTRTTQSVPPALSVAAAPSLTIISQDEKDGYDLRKLLSGELVENEQFWDVSEWNSLNKPNTRLSLTTSDYQHLQNWTATVVRHLQ
ncbi:hypothetical protein BC829DRAFT_442778 [Chytridium lagenaria]|nr:hypothetical protein BC829DRAFT_442778 [Chytridium lagenaria]